MANKASTEKGPQNTLQRGKACLRCRKRKMRCDGAKPACLQCSRAKKGDACEYDDGKGKTRTQLLRETITRLEQRIKQLEDPEYISPAVTLYDPHLHSQSESSSSPGSPSSSYLSASHSPFPSDSPTSPESWSLQGVPSPSPSPFVTDIFFDDSHSGFEPPVQLSQMLLEIFSPHRQQCGLEVHMGQLSESLNLPASEQRHPVLMNAIYLWACFMSRPEPLCQHEDHYLNRALGALPTALQSSDRIIDVIQASCLISMYFLANGRYIEGSYHASAASALAVQSGLHNRPSSHLHPWTHHELMEGADHKPPKSDVRDGERILTFWQVYNLDRCWSVILRKPTVIPDGPDGWNSITCPWPQDMADYEKGFVDLGVLLPTVRSFLDGSITPDGFSSAALRVKASTLFSQAEVLARSWSSKLKSRNHTEDINTLEHNISLFLSSLVQVNQFDAILPDDKQTLIIAYTLAHCAMIHLHRSFAQDDPVSYEKCSRAARACTNIVKHISDQDFTFLDPIIGPCWWSVSEILIKELDTVEASWPLLDSSSVRQEISTLLFAMTTLSARFPLIVPAITKVQKRLL